MNQSTPLLSRQKLLKSIHQHRFLLLMVIPGIVWMLIFCYFPLHGTQIAFQQYKITDTLGSSRWVGFQNFIKFFNDSDFGNVMKNTLGISFLKLIFGFTLPILFALLLNEVHHEPFKRIVQVITYLPHFLSWVVLGGIMINWLADTGIINSILINLGLMKEAVYFLGEPNYFWGITVISEVWKELGWGAIIYLAAIAGIDTSIYEAAAIDGANRFQRIRSITLPSIAPTIAIMFILAVGGIMGSNFDQIFVLKNPLNLPASNVIDIYVYTTGISRGNYSYATAVGLFRSLISLVLLVIANKVVANLQGTSLF